MIVCALCILYSCGCSHHARLDSNWSSPIKISETDEGLGVSFYAYKWDGMVLTLHSVGKANDKYDCSLSQDGITWRHGVLAGFSGFFVTPIIVTTASNRLVFISSKNSLTNAYYAIRTISLDADFHVNEIGNQEVSITPKLPSDQYVYGPVSGYGSSRGSEYFVPYTIRTMIRHGNMEEPPSSYPVGLFYSSDGGKSWQQKAVLDRQAWGADIAALKHEFYFFDYVQWGFGGDLWFSRQDIDQHSSNSEVLTKTCDGFTMANTDDTIHLCWLDSRHEHIPSQMSMFLFGSGERKSYEVFYRHITDSNSKWGKEILISKTSRYAYSPTISAEGKNVIIAWAGTGKPAEKYHDDYSPNDIYYSVSKDNGETWSEPVRVTDNMPQGMTGGCPQVILLNNVIHLFYIEGKYQKNPSVSGLSLIRQPPWPIYYTQRPFPK